MKFISKHIEKLGNQVQAQQNKRRKRLQNLPVRNQIPPQPVYSQFLQQQPQPVYNHNPPLLPVYNHNTPLLPVFYNHRESRNLIMTSLLQPKFQLICIQHMMNNYIY